MAQLSRVLQKIFGINGPTNEFGVIGSDAAGAPVNTKNLATMQSLSQYTDGLFAIAPNADEPPSAEDINSIYNLVTSQLAYVFQAGVPEWETNTDYYVGSYVQAGGLIYVSLSGVDPTPNQGNAPASSPNEWKLAFPISEFVNSQESFNNVIVRVAANQYKFRDDITHIKFQYLAGGYLMTGGSSPLSGGDTWGYIQTNACKQIIFENGASIHMGNERGYIEVNTDDCYLLNVSVIGTGTVASPIEKSFLLNANRVSFNNCNTINRLSNTSTFRMFHGSITLSHNATANYNNCSVKDITSTGSGGSNVGFYRCYNVVNSFVNNIINNTGTSSIIGFESCQSINNCLVLTVNSSTTRVVGYESCARLNNCKVEDLNSGGAQAYGFYVCSDVHNCIAYDIDSSANSAVGFQQCNYVTNCNASQIDHSGAVAGMPAYGFNVCFYLNSCYALAVNSNGTGADYGFYSCEYLNTCNAENCGLEGFNMCNYLTTCRANNNGQDGFNSCDSVVGCHGMNNSRYGYRLCNALSRCRASGNATGQYNVSYADWAATQTAQDTAAGGYNKIG